ncbi:hypothetical protein EJ05DRAFT_490738 [Pseudovirgaria hyperparasitica]|uniref:Uncharacterized protein n=1 Tax=Pseudovirgaria hyperparasitica TaxID=470096 RepID=A0A6A6VSA6_9PEZI|nr:uncharacterized protein EJ05DRAFT_490738 [Pseudovirgaria hyperparasitica]KAF2752666.1 hypothetical protein EJ05DRAFT_490738 [Pseudovirgaria hyperparasitica]
MDELVFIISGTCIKIGCCLQRSRGCSVNHRGSQMPFGPGAGGQRILSTKVSHFRNSRNDQSQKMSEPDYKKLFEQEQRRREEAERAREEARQAQIEEQRRREQAEQAQLEEQQRREDEQRRREEAELRIQRTTLPEFLHTCHLHLCLGFTVQTDASRSTQGNPDNAQHKLRPRHNCIWPTFRRSGFFQTRRFKTINTLEELGQSRLTVEDPVSEIVAAIADDHELRSSLGLKGSVSFENHGNTLSPDSQIKQAVQAIDISDAQRRSARLQSQHHPSHSIVPSADTDPAALRSSRPRADQFCVYHVGSGEQSYRQPALIIEYKAPHKVSLACICAGLQEMDLDDVVQVKDTEGVEAKLQRLVAAIIVQAFSYMIQIGVEYGCVCTGEAYIYLRVLDDPGTVYYHLSVPKHDIGVDTGWTPALDQPNRLHMTAVGRMLALTLMAIQTTPRSQKWKSDARTSLEPWEVTYEELLDQVPTPERLTSDYIPPSCTIQLRHSPIQLRKRSLRAAGSCSPLQPQERSSSDTEPEPDTPVPSTRRPASCRAKQERTPRTQRITRRTGGSGEGKKRQYCTPKCLRGLNVRGPLDHECPNVKAHGRRNHRIGRSGFLRLMHKQLSRDLDHDVECVRIHGSRGVLFRVCLTSHGYTVAAKGTTAGFVSYLRHEAAVYGRLRSIQGEHVPVHLGNIDLTHPYNYDGIAELTHMMFMSFGGVKISREILARHSAEIRAQVERATCSIHQHGVLHRDLELRNVLWCPAERRVAIIDFERARMPEVRSPLGEVSPNRKRKRQTEKPPTSRNSEATAFIQERLHVLKVLGAT